MPDTRLVTGEVERADGTAEQVIAVIGAPARRDLGDGYVCTVAIPKLFQAEQLVTGADATGARRHALEFVEAAFARHGVALVWRSPG